MKVRQNARKILSPFLSLTLTLALCLSIVPAPASAAGADFTIHNGYLEKYTGPGGDVVIPDGVTSIGEFAFSECSNLTSVTIPDSVTKIGNDAFSYCRNLTSVTILNSVTAIGERAFSGCVSLSSVTLPGNLPAIGAWAFDGTPWLEGLGEFAVVNGMLIRYQGSGTDVVIPDGVTSIGGGAFQGSGLTGVTIPNSVTYIGDYAFSGCRMLTGITIPDSVVSIGDRAFFNCELASIVIPESVTTIGAHAFQACHRLTSVALPSSITEISESAFSTCSRLTSVIIPEGITSIGDEAFAFCVSLTSVTIPNSVTAIGSRAFHTSDWANFDHVPIPGLALSGAAGSYAERYAKEEGIPFVADPNGLEPSQPIPASGTAYATPQTVLVDGKEVKFDTYALKNEEGNFTNYIKLRDLALILNGTAAQFQVVWNQDAQSIEITSKTAYTPEGIENNTPYSGDRDYEVSTSTILINGQKVLVTAIILYDDNNMGYTYFQLRDLGKNLGFNVSWDREAQTIVVESDKPYTDD